MARLVYELSEIVQVARHMSDQDWRVFTAKAHEALAVRAPYPTAYWVVQAEQDGIAYVGPFDSELEARDTEAFKRSWGLASVIELPSEDARVPVAPCGRIA